MYKQVISTHTPLAGRDGLLCQNYHPVTISTHTPLAGRDDITADMTAVTTTFLLTRPSRDVTEMYHLKPTSQVISTHTPLAGRDGFLLCKTLVFFISTHTPLAGRDADVVGLPGIHIISTHTPLAGRDKMSMKTKRSL